MNKQVILWKKETKTCKLYSKRNNLEQKNKTAKLYVSALLLNTTGNNMAINKSKITKNNFLLQTAEIISSRGFRELNQKKLICIEFVFILIKGSYRF